MICINHCLLRRLLTILLLLIFSFVKAMKVSFALRYSYLFYCLIFNLFCNCREFRDRIEVIDVSLKSNYTMITFFEYLLTILPAASRIFFVLQSLTTIFLTSVPGESRITDHSSYYSPLRKDLTICCSINSHFLRSEDFLRAWLFRSIKIF